MIINRRNFLKSAGALAGGTCASTIWADAPNPLPGRKATDVRIRAISHRFDDYLYRVPMKFAGEVMDRATLLTVECEVEAVNGKVGKGFGTTPFNHIFSYPSKAMSHEEKNGAMKALADELARVTAACRDAGHPIEFNQALTPQYDKAAEEVSRRLQLKDPIPKLCTLVTASAYDAAIHDAFGKAHGVNSFQTYSSEFMNADLSHYLGDRFSGEYPSRYLLPKSKAQMPLCHLISAIDPLGEADNAKPIKDGLPETLVEWIRFNGLKEFKIKLNGEDLQWDLNRALEIDRVVTEAQGKRAVDSWSYVLDFNEKCPSVTYYVEFLRKLKEAMPVGFRRIRYVEQPTSRELKAHPENAMHEAATLCPTVIDESLVDGESLLLARDLGWTGAVVKSPKGLSNMVLLACLAMKEKMLLCGGDMSCPGGALVQTACFQARVPTITSIEANARQYFPQANAPWEARFPGIFRVKDGIVQTSELNGPGLGA